MYVWVIGMRKQTFSSYKTILYMYIVQCHVLQYKPCIIIVILSKQYCDFCITSQVKQPKCRTEVRESETKCAICCER